MKKLKEFNSFINEIYDQKKEDERELVDLNERYPKGSWVGIQWYRDPSIIEFGEVISVNLVDISRYGEFSSLAHSCHAELKYKSDDGKNKNVCIYGGGIDYIKYQGATKEDVKTEIAADNYNI